MDMIKKFVRFIVVNLYLIQTSRLQHGSHLVKPTKDVMEKFEVVVGDSLHLFKENVLKGILEKMRMTAIRFGTTGTLDGSECHRLQLEGMFGPVKKVISTKELIEDGTIANLSIDCVILCHTKQKKIHTKKRWISCF